MNPDAPTHIDTNGGSAFLGDFDNREGVYVGRDLNLNIEMRFSGNQLQALLDQLLALLRVSGVRVRDGEITAGGETLAVSQAEIEALGKYLADTPAPDSAQREARYLARLCVHPDYQQWQARYVTLSGSVRVAPELTPRYSEIQVWGDGPQREIKRVPLPDIRDALERYPAFLIKGLPGAGKTTVLQRLALDQALARLHDPAAARLPLWVRLTAQKPEETPHEFLVRMWRLENPGGSDQAEAELIQTLRGGRLCILCDALNEARSALHERYGERTAEWREFAEKLPAGNRLVFSCRTQDYLGELGVQQVEIDPLTDEQIEDFARCYLGDPLGAAFWADLRDQNSTLLPLARTPFYLKMMVEEWEADGHLPPVRARLFAGFTEKLLGREAKRRHPDWIEPAAQHLALSQLAFAIQELDESIEVSRAWALNALPDQVLLPDGEVVPTPPAAVLRLARAATLLSETVDHNVRFSHHLFQEYFAAGELLWRLREGGDLAGLWRVPGRVGEMPEAERGQWDPLPGPPPTRWEQTTILAAGLHPALIAAVHGVNPALAARCALESGLDWEGGEVAPELVETCRQTLLARLGDVRFHLRSRIEAGLLLGRLKDPRFPVETVGSVQVILPPMVEIAAAEARIGSSLLDLQAFGDERPRHKVPLVAYEIGRYPVTNAEYACFIAAGGYEEDRWWTEGGKFWLRGEPVPGEADPTDWWMETWRRRKENPAEIDEQERQGTITRRDAAAWREFIKVPEDDAIAQFREWYPAQGQRVTEPRFRQDPDFNNLSQPVVGVCWYEAAAYANWLADVTGLAFRLPSEPEWEWAARRSARHFPWGRRWNAERLNSLEGRVMRTTPVGAYPHGATPDGLHDLAGNVWEWTATRYARYPYDPGSDLENPDATGVRMARGGGWAANRRMERCAYRDRNFPRDRIIALGYRLARAYS